MKKKMVVRVRLIRIFVRGKFFVGVLFLVMVLLFWVLLRGFVRVILCFDFRVRWCFE